MLEDMLEGDLRHLRLPGAGDAGGEGARRLFSLGEADLLRRAMGKKIKAEMDAQRERFVAGCGRRQRRSPRPRRTSCST